MLFSRSLISSDIEFQIDVRIPFNFAAMLEEADARIEEHDFRQRQRAGLLGRLGGRIVGRTDCGGSEKTKSLASK